MHKSCNVVKLNRQVTATAPPSVLCSAATIVISELRVAYMPVMRGKLIAPLVLLFTILCLVDGLKILGTSATRRIGHTSALYSESRDSLGSVDNAYKSRPSGAKIFATIFSMLIPLMSIAPMSANADLGPLITEKEVIVYLKVPAQFLKNPVLEAIRKIDQTDPDTEFQNVNKVILLVPIVDILKDIETVSKLISANEADLIKANEILTNKKFDTAPFKKTFNRYSDNIYYSDPERANIYLAGGAVPNTQQTTQYLFRNSALTSIGDVKEDVRFLLEDVKKKKVIDPQTVADAVDDCREALEAMTSYFELADPVDVKEARTIVYNTPK